MVVRVGIRQQDQKSCERPACSDAVRQPRREPTPPQANGADPRTIGRSHTHSAACTPADLPGTADPPEEAADSVGAPVSVIVVDSASSAGLRARPGPGLRQADRDSWS